jgi:hypothetical protein
MSLFPKRAELFRVTLALPLEPGSSRPTALPGEGGEAPRRIDVAEIGLLAHLALCLPVFARAKTGPSYEYC